LNDFADMVGTEGWEEFLRESWRLRERVERSQEREAARRVLLKRA
jgi:hypothetical protein